jgi:hypothetical protein
MTRAADLLTARRLGAAPAERRTFTLSRSRAIEKLRAFALADPHYFVLELAQSAIANHAQSLHVRTSKDRFSLTYHGGHFVEAELAALLDFLFAGKHREDVGHVRELALGVNALWRFEPERIIVESGDGTVPGSTRLVLSPRDGAVDVSHPGVVIAGTAVKVEGMRRSRVEGESRLQELPGLTREAAALEERCLTAPVPIVVNDRPLFGVATRRIPLLPGFHRTLAVDEGDLYGVIGVDPATGGAGFKLLTWGVWIQSVAHPTDPHRFGGVICFDRLRKTIDHSGIVHDEVWEELWARLRPYEEQLRSGRGEPPQTLRLVGLPGPLSSREVRELLRERGRAVVVHASELVSPTGIDRAVRLGRAVDGPVLSAAPLDPGWLRALAGPDVALLALQRIAAEDLQVLESAPLPLPARPYLAPAAAMADLTAATLPPDAELSAEALDELLGRGWTVRGTVYTPADRAAGATLQVELLVLGHLVASCPVSAPYPGHLLRIELPAVAPSLLLSRSRLADEPWTSALARLAAAHARPALEAASARALAELTADRAAGPERVSARGIVLAALARSALLVLRRGADGRPCLAVEPGLGDLPAALLDWPIVTTLAGEPLGLRGLLALIDRCEGLAYGVVPEVPADLSGLDRSRILDLDADQERALIGLLGEATYVRVDARDVLASHGRVACRDVAVGLRPYPGFPLLVEGDDPTAWDPADQRAALLSLVTQLVSLVRGTRPVDPGDRERAAWEEARRQACRHLQWLVCQAPDPAADDGLHDLVAELPLFLTPDGLPRTFREVQAGLRTATGVLLAFGPRLGLGELATLAARPSVEPLSAVTPVTALLASPGLARRLAALGNVTLSGDLVQPVAPAASGAAGTGLVRVQVVAGPLLEGRLGLVVPGERPARLDVLDPATGQIVSHAEVAHRYGVSGLLRYRGSLPLSAELPEVARAVLAAAAALATAALDALASVPADAPDRVDHVSALLQLAGHSLGLVARPDGTITSRVDDPLAARILDLPLFPGERGVLTGARLVQELCTRGRAPLARPGDPPGGSGARLAPEAPAHLRAWVETFLDPDRVARPAASALPRRGTSGDGARPGDGLGEALTSWFAALRPGADDDDRPAFRFEVGRAALAAGPAERVLQHVLRNDAGWNVILDGASWLVAWALERGPEDRVALATLFLAVVAEVNAILPEVTNAEELQIQLRVAQALVEGPGI